MIKLYTIIYETGPSAQSFYGSLNDPRVSRLDDAEDLNLLNISSNWDDEEDLEEDTSLENKEDDIAKKITP